MYIQTCMYIHIYIIHTHVVTYTHIYVHVYACTHTYIKTIEHNSSNTVITIYTDSRTKVITVTVW